MKNIIYLGLVIFMLTSCDRKEEYKQKKSEAIEFAGDWYYQKVSPSSGNVIINYQKNKLRTYNTSANEENEIWIDDRDKVIHMKFKAVLSENQEDFVSAESDNLYYSSDVVYPALVVDIGETATAFQSYKSFEVVSGKILKNAAYSKSGSLVDSIFFHIAAHMDRFTFSREIDEIDTTWNIFKADSTLSWNVDTTIHVLDTSLTWWDQDWVQINDSVFYEIDSSESWSFDYDTTVSDIDTTGKWTKLSTVLPVVENFYISGHRYTGFPDDDY